MVDSRYIFIDTFVTRSIWVQTTGEIINKNLLFRNVTLYIKNTSLLALISHSRAAYVHVYFYLTYNCIAICLFMTI